MHANGADTLAQRAARAFEDGRRLVAPLVGSPGCRLVGHSIKLAQQNVAVHAATVKAIYDRFRPDAVFFLMDLAVEANALGLPVRFPLYDSATVEQHPVRSADDLKGYRDIPVLGDGKVQTYVQTMQRMAGFLPADVIRGAYVIGPFTLAGLLAGAQEIALDVLTDRAKVHELVRFSCSVVEQYGRALLAAGAQLLCILEPTAVMLGPRQFEEFSGQYVQRLIGSAFASPFGQPASVVYHICGNTMHLLEAMAETGAQGLSLDSPETGVDLAAAAKRVGPGVAIIGNVNPTKVMLHGTAADEKVTVNELAAKMAGIPNFILSTGCDLPPETPLENIDAFMQAGRAISSKP